MTLCQSVAHVFRLPPAGCAILSRERDKKVVGDTLERDLRAIYGAYEYLREHDRAAVSTTYISASVDAEVTDDL